MYFFSGAEVCTNFTPVFEVMSINCGIFRFVHASFCAPAPATRLQITTTETTNGKILKNFIVETLLPYSAVSERLRGAFWQDRARPSNCKDGSTENECRRRSGRESRLLSARSEPSPPR